MKKNWLYSDRRIFSFRSEKKFRIMKISVFLFFTGIISIYAGNSYSQTTKLSLDVNEASVGEVLTSIENQSEFYFLYSNKLVDANRKVSLQAVNKPVRKILDNLFADTDVRYVVYDRQIILSPEGMLEKTIEKQNSPPQETVVTGKVTDEDGNTLPGVNIVVKGTLFGTITNADGNYSIEVDDPNVTLVFSFIGYQSLEKLVSNQTVINVILEIEAYSLDEVVAVGYGVVRREDLTGSVASVSSDVITKRPQTSVTQVLSGRVSGVSVLTGSGAPGGGMVGRTGGNAEKIGMDQGTEVRIRGYGTVMGSQEPLYVVDGIVGFSNINLINPDDIVSIDVLKDASSTSIYGARGSNGVIIIETKRRRGIGEKETQVSYSGYGSVSTLSKKIDMMNSEEYLSHLADAYSAQGLVAPFLIPANKSEEWYKELFDSNGNPKYDTDWQDVVYGNPNFSHNHNLNITQGTESSNFGLSSGYNHSEGLADGNNYERFTERIYWDSEISKRMHLNVSVDYNESKGTTGGGSGAVKYMALAALPIYPEDGRVFSSSSFPSASENMNLPGAYMGYQNDEIKYSQIIGSAKLDIELMEDMILTSTFSLDHVEESYSRYTSKNALDARSGAAEIFKTTGVTVQQDNYITYSKNFSSSHEFKFVVGNSLQHYKKDRTVIDVSGFVDDFYQWHNLSAGAQSTKRPDSGYDAWAMAAVFGRINYSLNKKYLATFTLRGDASSSFSKGNKWGYFPSGALGWRLSEEPFMDNINWLDNLKLRASYGLTGNVPRGTYSNIEIGSYASTTEVTDGNYYARVTMGDIPVAAAGTDHILNDADLKWEKTAQFDIGFDMSILDRRIDIVADYYNKQTHDLLFYAGIVPYSAGFMYTFTNIGEMENKGIEVSVNSRNIQGKNFNWNSMITFSSNKNQIKKLTNVGGKEVFSEEMDPSSNGLNLCKYEVGSPFMLYQGLLFDSFDPVTGAMRYKELDENGNLTGSASSSPSSKDKTTVGNGTPSWEGFITNNFSYKNWSFNIEFQVKQGFDIYNLFRATFEATKSVTTGGINGFKTVATDGGNGVVPSANIAYPSPYPSDLYVEDGSYVRLSNINLSYDFENLGKLKLDNLVLYVNVQNVHVWTKYTGYDPEVKCHGQSWATNISSSGEYPKPRVYVLGLKLAF